MADIKESKPVMLLVFATIGPGTEAKQVALQDALIAAVQNVDAGSASPETQVLSAVGYFD